MTLERLYYSNQKIQIQNGSNQIKEHSYVNLLTVNQINFTKGLVVKKHLVVKKAEGSDAELDDEDEEVEQSENILHNQSSKKDGKKKVSYLKKKTTFLQYVVQFHLVNIKNFNEEALGGLIYNRIPWCLQLEQASAHTYNLMRNGIQLICTNKDQFKKRKLIINQIEPQWEPEEKNKLFLETHEKELEGLNDTQKRTLMKCFNCQDYQMIIGVPGTGKTEIIIRFLRIARKLKMKVLLVN